VFILEGLKVICFHALLQVLILNSLSATICTKIVQHAGLARKCWKQSASAWWGRTESKKRQQDAGAIWNQAQEFLALLICLK
jgi:hypothetical protein